ncbi:MAG: sialidase family protein [Bacteroidota bacterium]
MRFYFLVFLYVCTHPLIAQEHTELIIKNKIDHLSSLAREPMVAEHPNGSLFVTGYTNGTDSPQLWESKDGGKNWQAVYVGSAEDGAQGNSDVDLFIDDEGNIFLLSMTYTKLPEDLENFDFSTMKGEQITLGVSRDEGQSWDWQFISRGDYDDRPWITATTNGNLHIIWNDGKGVHHRVSKDAGESWDEMPAVNPKGGSSHMTSGPDGQLAVRVSPMSASGFQMDEGVDLIRLSLDQGESWKDVSLPGNRDWNQDMSGIPRWVEPLAFDTDNTLYAMWSEGSQMKLAKSADNGDSWEEFIISQGQDTTYFPYMVASEQGLLCTWLSGFSENIRHHAAVVNIDEDVVKVHSIDPQKLDIWSRFAVGTYERYTGGEYFPIIPLSNGNIGMVTTIQNAKAERLGFSWWELKLSAF